MASIENELKTVFKNEHHKCMLNIMFTGNWFLRLHTQALKPFGISQQQYNMLRILRGAGSSLNMNEVKERMLDKTPNLTRMTEKLIQKELIVKTRGPLDRRNIYIKISEKGLAILKDIDKLWIEDNAPELKLTNEECKTISHLLDKIRN